MAEIEDTVKSGGRRHTIIGGVVATACDTRDLGVITGRLTPRWHTRACSLWLPHRICLERS
eukprot:SAG31_NODE_45169_length_260_cov_0.565217_1_plen_60_part_10